MTLHSLQQFAFNKQSRLLSASTSDLRLKTFPTEIKVRSHHTGIVMTFEYDNIAAIRHEFWDGEMAEYVPKGDASKVAKLVLIKN